MKTTLLTAHKEKKRQIYLQCIFFSFRPHFEQKFLLFQFAQKIPSPGFLREPTKESKKEIS